MAKGQEIIPLTARNQTALWIFIGIAFLEALIWQILGAILQLSIKLRPCKGRTNFEEPRTKSRFRKLALGIWFLVLPRLGARASGRYRRTLPPFAGQIKNNNPYLSCPVERA